ncbi:MAG: TIGR04283 family arsenosugar biosynthesis glycosyltransferase [Thermoplasmatota archaeon]
MRQATRISVIIPVLNEGKNINHLIEHLRNLPGGRKLEIIVADGSPEKDTLKAIRYTDIKKVSSDTGRGIQMNTGASRAEGDILLFLHADTLLPDNGPGLIISALDDPEIAAGAFDLEFIRVSPIISILVPLHNWMRRVSKTPYGDQAIFIRRSVFRKLGGFREIKLFEDMDLMKRLGKGGYRIRILRERVRTSARNFNERGPLRTLGRNIFIVGLYHMGVHPDRLAGLYRK